MKIFNGCITVSTILKENFLNIWMYIFYSFKKKNMPYAYPLDWSKMPYPANTGSGTPWGSRPGVPPPSGERTCRGTSTTTVNTCKSFGE